MNIPMAAAAGGIVFGLSFIAGLFGGVPFFDIVIRAVVWGAVGFGGSLGIETVLKSLIPDLFVPRSEDSEPAPDRSVDITIEEERPGGFVEEEGEAPAPRAEAPAGAEAAAPAAPPRDPETAPGGSEEEMPEIGSFLDAFKPQGPGGEGETEGESESGESSPDYGAYSPGGHSGEVTIDGEAQDPVILAKAIQTVMKRDAQGS